MQHATKKDIWNVPLANIRIEDEFNVRIDYGDIKELANSIRESGLKQPLRGHRDKDNSELFIITDGHRRLKAMQLNAKNGDKIESVPFVLEPRNYNSEGRILDLLLCNSGKNLTPFEESIVYQRLINLKWETKQIAEKSGKSLSHVYDMLKLQSAPQSQKNKIIENKISEGAVVKIHKATKNQKEQDDLIDEAIQNAGNKKATLKHISSSTKAKNPLQILEAVMAKIRRENVNTKAAILFVNIIEAAQEKQSVDFIFDLAIGQQKI